MSHKLIVEHNHVKVKLVAIFRNNRHIQAENRYSISKRISMLYKSLSLSWNEKELKTRSPWGNHNRIEPLRKL